MLRATTITATSQIIHQQDGITISRPNKTIVYKKIGKMYPAVNMGHIRITVNISQMREIVENLCEMARLTAATRQYTKTAIMHQLSQQVQTIYSNSTEKQNCHSLSFAKAMNSNVKQLVAYCDQAKGIMALVSEVLGAEAVTMKASSRVCDKRFFAEALLLIKEPIIPLKSADFPVRTSKLPTISMIYWQA